MGSTDGEGMPRRELVSSSRNTYESEGFITYEGNGKCVGSDGNVKFVDEGIQNQLACLKKPKTAERYLNQYGFFARVAGELGQLDLHIQERYDTARTTLRKVRRKGSVSIA